MTERVTGFWVSLDKTMREDDVQPILDAVTQLRGVCAVTTHRADPMDFILRSQIRREFIEKLWDVLKYHGGDDDAA